MPSTKADAEHGGHPRYGFWRWAAFVLAVGAVLAVAAGCMAAMYAPVFSGG